MEGRTPVTIIQQFLNFPHCPKDFILVKRYHDHATLIKENTELWSLTFSEV